MAYVYRERSREEWEARLRANDDNDPIWEYPEYHIRVRRPKGSSYQPPERGETRREETNKTGCDPFAAFSDKPRWLGWREEEKRNGRPTKVPYAPRTGRRGSSTHSADWASRDEAERYAAELPKGVTGGIGITLGDNGDGTCLAGIDLDSSLCDGALASWATDILAVLNTYAEVSPSGGGLKAFLLARSDDVRRFLDLIGVERYKWGRKRSIPGLSGDAHGPAIEVYAGARFFTVTGKTWSPEHQRITLFDWPQLKKLAALIPQPSSSSSRSSTRQTSTGSASGHTRTSGTDARPWITPQLREVIRQGRDPQNPTRWVSRSEAVFYVTCELARAWWTDAQIAAELLDQRNGISAHLYDQDNPQRATERVIDHAREALAQDAARGHWQERQHENGRDRDEQPDIPELLDVTQYAMPPPRQFLYGTEFCRKFLSVLIGIGKVGKTSLRIAQGMSVAIGENLLRSHRGDDDHVHIRGRVLYMTFEDDIDELNRRCWGVRKHYQIDDSKLANWFFPWAPDAKVAKEKDGTIKPGALETQLRGVIAKYGIDLIIFDPLIQVYEGDISENDNARMNAVINILTRLGIELNIAVDILRHDRKGAHEPGDPDRGRGGGSVNDRGRLVRTLTHMSKEEARKYGIGEVERRSLVRYDDAQVSLTAVQDARWFRLMGVPIGNPDAVFTIGDIVQCIEPCDAPRALGDLPDDVVEAILDEIDSGLPDGRRYSPHHSAKTERQAWKIVSRIAQRTEEQARATINGWVKDGLLRSDNTSDPVSRKKVTSLSVNWDIWDERKGD